MKTIKKLIVGISLCLLLGLVIPTGGSETAAAAENNTVRIGYMAQGAGTGIDPEHVTTVDKGNIGKPVKTGDSTNIGKYTIILIGSAAIILILLLAREKKEEKENRF